MPTKIPTCNVRTGRDAVPEHQSPADMFARVDRMADVGKSTTLSIDDVLALRWLLDSHARLLSAAEIALPCVRALPALSEESRREQASILAVVRAAIEAAGGGT